MKNKLKKVLLFWLWIWIAWISTLSWTYAFNGTNFLSIIKETNTNISNHKSINFQSYLWRQMKHLKIKMFSDVKNIKQEIFWSHKLWLNWYSSGYVTKHFNKLKQKFSWKLADWRNLIAVDNNWNLLWLVNVADNFNFYPAKLKGNWWTKSIKESNPILKLAINQTQNNYSHKVTNLIVWNKQTKELLFSTNFLKKVKNTFIWNTNQIWNRVKPIIMTFDFWSWDVALKIYWVYNIATKEVWYIKNLWNVITNSYTGNIITIPVKTWKNLIDPNPKDFNITHIKRNIKWPFTDVNFVKCLSNKYYYNWTRWAKKKVQLTFNDNWNWTYSLTSNNANKLTNIECWNKEIKNINGIWAFPNVTEIQLPDNKLNNLPKKITNIKNLKELDLKWNKNLGDFSNNFNKNSKSITAKKLAVVWNWIADINLTIKWNWTNITFSYRPVFTDWNFVKCLEKGDISNQSRHFVKLTFNDNWNWTWSLISNNASQIKHIECWNKEIKNINGISNFSNLIVLDLDYNQITSLPSTIWNLTNLTQLYLYDNQLTNLPKEFWNLTNFNWLDLGWNQLTTFPKEIWNLTNLTQLYLNNNQLTTLPDTMTKLTNLCILDLSQNTWLWNWNKTFWYDGQYYMLGTTTSVWNISISVNNPQSPSYNNVKVSIKKVVKWPFTDKNFVKCLSNSSNVWNWNWQHIKLKFTNNWNWTRSLTSNNASQVGIVECNPWAWIKNINGIWIFTNIFRLTIQSNQLTTLPSSIWNLTNLKNLNLSNNKLTILPSSMTYLTKLSSLLLNNNYNLLGLNKNWWADWGYNPPSNGEAQVVAWYSSKFMHIQWKKNGWNYNIIITVSN